MGREMTERGRVTQAAWDACHPHPLPLLLHVVREPFKETPCTSAQKRGMNIRLVTVNTHSTQSRGAANSPTTAREGLCAIKTVMRELLVFMF